VKKTAVKVLRLAVISGLNPGPLMDADGPLMEQPSGAGSGSCTRVGKAALGRYPRFPSTSKINNHHSTIINQPLLIFSSIHSLPSTLWSLRLPAP